MHDCELQQLQWSDQSSDYEPVSCQTIPTDKFVQYEARLQEALLEACPAELWCKGSYLTGCPRPILVSRHHQEQLQNLHEALTLAITDIVQRWWTDPKGRFPERMPLEREEEELLKWLEDQVAQGNVRKFSECQGSWRPDFLVDKDVTGEEAYRITEINARFSFNGFFHQVYGQRALNESLPEPSSLKGELRGETDPEMMLDGLFSLFNLDDPLHLLKGAEHGIDIHMFVDAVWRRFGRKPRLITPADLRLLPDPGSESGYRLCCLSSSYDGLATPSGTWTFTARNGEIWEEIRQVGLELHQRELVALDPEMLRQISLRCFNDMRTILLVHDKRMLGIVKQEIPRLVARSVLTPGQAKALDKGIADSILPGSEELSDLLQRCRASADVKNQYILKPIRSGKGDGIVFGEDIDAEEWMSSLERLVFPKVVPGVTCVVQRRIHPLEYDLVLKASRGLVRYALVGTFHVVNGRLLGLGIWRSSGDRIIAVSTGGSWVCSVVEQV